MGIRPCSSVPAATNHDQREEQRACQRTVLYTPVELHVVPSPWGPGSTTWGSSSSSSSSTFDTRSSIGIGHTVAVVVDAVTDLDSTRDRLRRLPCRHSHRRCRRSRTDELHACLVERPGCRTRRRRCPTNHSAASIDVVVDLAVAVVVERVADLGCAGECRIATPGAQSQTSPQPSLSVVALGGVVDGRCSCRRTPESRRCLHPGPPSPP